MAAFETQFESVQVANFTAFRKLQLDLSPGLNVLIGPNATGKTHLMKVLYAAAAVSAADTDLAEKLVGVFVPHQRRIGRLVTRRQGSAECQVTIHRPQSRLTIRFSSHAQPTSKTPPIVTGLQRWRETPIVSAFIPVKEMLTGGAQLVALYQLRELELEEVYVDIVTRALLPLARGQVDARRQKLLDTLNREMSGKVEVVDDRFFHRSSQGRLEFSLLSEGYRKLGLLWLLIQNRTLLDGSVLFWDEPEANLNPALIGCVIGVLLDLQRLGVQVFIATHSHVVLKEIELRRAGADEVRYVSFFRGDADGVQVETAGRLFELDHDKIRDTYVDLVERDLQLSL